MIIGNGSIARLLNDRPRFIFFASGISDSEMDDSLYWSGQKYREHSMLTDAIKNAFDEELMLVYFSTISKFTKDSPYIRHKKEMERVIRDLADDFCIINLGNVWGCTNPNTFINKMEYWERQDKLLPSMIRDEYKYMTTRKQLNFITDNLPRRGQHEISIFGEMLKVKECLNR